MAETKSTDLVAFRAAPMKEADEAFAQWYLDGSGAQFNKAQSDAFMEGIKAAARLGAEFARTPERKAQKAANKVAAETARKEAAAARAAAAKDKPAATKATAKGKAAPAKKGKPAAATDLI